MQVAAVIPTLTALPSLTFTPTATFAPTPTASSTPTPTSTPTLTPTPIRPLPELYVDGAYIKRRDTAESVQLKGVHIANFDNADQPTLTSTKRYIDIAKTWGANLLRIGLDMTKADRNMDELSKVLDYAETNGMYSVLTVANNNQNPITIPNDGLVNFMASLARRFKQKNNILYGLLNEPSSVKVGNRVTQKFDWDEWLPWANKIAGSILSENSRAVLIMCGTHYCRDYDYLRGNPGVFPYKNVIYDVHYYYWWNQSLQQDTTPATSQWDWMLGKVPTFFGEAGTPGGGGGRNDPNDAVFIEYTLQIIRRNPKSAHYTGFEMAPGNWGTSLLSPNGSPSKRGHLYHDDMAAFPPTDFSK
jgi:hypothetical protein